MRFEYKSVFQTKGIIILLLSGKQTKKIGGKKVRKKIEELRNKEEGFTLVELLAIIVILGIIVAIAIPAVGSVIDNSKSNAKTAHQEMVIDAARLYFTTSETDTGDKVTVTDLEKDGYLEVRSKDPGHANYNERATVTRKKTAVGADGTGGGYTYTYAAGE